MVESKAVREFKALIQEADDIQKQMSNSTRTKIRLYCLAEEYTITELSKKLELSYQNTFNHVKLLKKLGIVETRKDQHSKGRKVFVKSTGKNTQDIINEKYSKMNKLIS